KRAIKLVKKAVRQKRIDKDELEVRIKKILAAKYWLGLHAAKPVSHINLHADLNRNASMRLAQQLADNSITQLKGKDELSQLSFTKKTAIISIGSSSITTFQRLLNQRFDNRLNFI